MCQMKTVLCLSLLHSFQFTFPKLYLVSFPFTPTPGCQVIRVEGLNGTGAICSMNGASKIPGELPEYLALPM